MRTWGLRGTRRVGCWGLGRRRCWWPGGGGVVGGLPAVDVVLAEVRERLRLGPAAFRPEVADSAPVEAGAVLGHFAGPARVLLAAERTMLNLLGHLSGVATLTAAYVEAVAGTG